MLNVSAPVFVSLLVEASENDPETVRNNVRKYLKDNETSIEDGASIQEILKSNKAKMTKEFVKGLIKKIPLFGEALEPIAEILGDAFDASHKNQGAAPKE